MTTDTEITYETKTVRAVRGMESRTIEKWESEGWEVVSQVPAKIRTEITFRRPAPKSRRGLLLSLLLSHYFMVRPVGRISIQARGEDRLHRVLDALPV